MRFSTILNRNYESLRIRHCHHWHWLGNYYIIHGGDSLKDNQAGTKCAPVYSFTVEAQGKAVVEVRLTKNTEGSPFGKTFDAVFEKRKAEADTFYKDLLPKNATADVANIQRQAFAGMLWSKQYYNIDIPLWLNGDKGQPPPPAARKTGRRRSLGILEQ
jgi:hypothetical protein